MRNLALIFLGVFHLFCISSCSVLEPEAVAVSTRGDQTSARSTRPKNIILFIGDGMGPQQIGLLLLARAHGKEIGISTSSGLVDIFTKGSLGLVQPKPVGGLVIDSACSATALATGHLGLPETLGFDAKGQIHPTIVEIASSLGMSTGLVSDTRITHATPAAFYARIAHRNDENEIAAQLIASKVSVALSGGARHFAAQGDKPRQEAPFTITSSRLDERDLIAEARGEGASVVFSQKELSSIMSERVIGLFAESSMEDAFLESSRGSSQPSLSEMTAQSLRLLSRNPKGFFLMIEAGQIDWAAHANDAGWLLREMLRADQALDAVLTWMESRTDTLLVVTADHETGGFGFSYNASNIPPPRPFPGATTSSEQYKPQYNFVPPTALKELLLQKAPLRTVGKWWSEIPVGNRTAKTLRKRLMDTTGIALEDEALRPLMTQVPNRFYVKGHKDLGEKQWTDLCAYDAFHPSALDRFSTAISRELASHYGITWSTGTHTSTPVLAAWLGSESFNPPRLMATEDLGAELIQMICSGAPVHDNNICPGALSGFAKSR